MQGKIGEYLGWLHLQKQRIWTWGVLCWISNTKYPRNFWGMPSWDDQLLAVSLRAVFIRAPVLVIFLGKILQKWDRGMVLTDAPWSTLMWRGLLP